MKPYILIASALMLFATSLNAQPQGKRQGPPEMKKPAEIAQETADKMKSEVSLTDKQYKKVYKLVKKDHEYRQKAARQNMPGGMPPNGGGPGMGGPEGGMQGGGPGMGGGMQGGMPGGMGGGMQGGGPGMGGGMQFGGPEGGMPGGGPGMGQGESPITDEYLEKQDKKLKKILSEEQYAKWRKNHPAEHLDLPPVEFN